jgi:hypothetical protein
MINPEALVMVSRCLSAGATALVVSATPAFAQLNFQHHPTDPYRNLFAGKPVDQRPLLAREAGLGTNTPQKPVVACGTLVVPSDPTVDPKIRVGPREDGVGHTMRVLPPPACNNR